MSLATSALLEAARASIRPPSGRFRHPWLAPMPMEAQPDTSDGFKRGQYGAGLFHHDASEASIELLHHEAFRPACEGSLLCLLDAMLPSGLVPRTLLPHKARDLEPARPVLAQWAERICQHRPEGAEAWLRAHRVVDRLECFVQWWRQTRMGPHGLFTAHSARASGFDCDLLTAHLPTGAVATPDLNVFMVLELRALAALCARIDRPYSHWVDEADALRERIDALLWDASIGAYGAIGFKHGARQIEDERVRSVGPGEGDALESWVGLLPLLLDAPAERAERMLADLRDPDGYMSEVGPRTVPKRSPYFSQAPRVLLYDHQRGRRGPVSNWQGPVWMLSSYYLWEASRAAGDHALAREISKRSLRLIERAWDVDGRFFECWDDEGRGLWPPEGTFASFNLLALTMARS